MSHLRDVSERPRQISGLVPPHNLIAEGILLSNALVNHSVAEARTIVDPPDFYSSDNGKIWGVLLELADAGEPIEGARVLEVLVARGASPVDMSRYLTELEIGQPATTSPAAHARCIREAAWKRRLIARLQACTAELYAADLSLDAWIDGTRPLIDGDFSEARSSVDAPRIFEVMQDRFADAMRDPEDRREKPGIKLGISTLDSEIVGGLGGLTLVTAARNGGKSSFLACVLVNIFRANVRARGEPGGELAAGVLFSLEMSRGEYADLFVANLGNINSRHLREPDSLDDAERTRYAGAIEFESSERYAITVFDDKRRKSIAFVRSMARAQAQAFKRRGIRLTVIGIDHLQLLKPAPTPGVRAYASREEEIDAIAEQLKELAAELDVNIIALSQINAQGQARGSRAVEAHADNVFRLKLGKKGSFGEAREATIVIEKQRRGENAITVPVWFYPQFSRFEA